MNTPIKALVCDTLAADFAGLSLRTISLGPPEAGQVQIRVSAAALNFPDLLMTRGEYQHKPELPFVSGMEGAGTITALAPELSSGAASPGIIDGANANAGSAVMRHPFRVGQRVRFSCRSGAFAEAVNVPANAVFPLPDSLSDEQGAAFHVGALTAYVSLVRRASLRSGETLLVHGASGGMGLAAVQLGAHLGATVIATGSDDAKLAIAAQLGATHTLNISGARARFREPIKSLTAGRGVDVVFDPVGGDVFDESIRVMAWNGRLLVVGFASGRIPSLAVNMALIKGFSVIGVRAGEFGRREPTLGQENELALTELADRGVMTPYVGACYPLSQGFEAFRALRDRRVAGKIVINP